jgi:hypothetical protein
VDELGCGACQMGWQGRHGQRGGCQVGFGSAVAIGAGGSRFQAHTCEEGGRQIGILDLLRG